MNIPIPGLVLHGPSGPDTLKLERGLGAGAFGVVFLAVDLKDGSQYAVKFPQFALFGGQPELAAFLNEVEVAKKIRHPNVVDVVFVQQPTGPNLPFLVMPYLTEGTLKDQLESLRKAGAIVDLDVLEAWTLGLVAGMEAINAHFLHRDLKPDNILMDKGVPRISDFGLAKVIGAATRSLTFKGHQHLLYMAPEGWRSEQNTVQLDMYSLGLVLYEVASLRYPYTIPGNWNDSDAFRRMHFFERAPALGSIRADLPLGYCQAVTRLMEKPAENRFRTWAELHNSLTRAFAQRGSGPEAQGSTVQSLMRAVGGAHQERTARDLEAQKRDAQRKEEEEIDHFQAAKLSEEIEGVASAFNSASSLGTIESRNHPGNRGSEYRLPNGATLALRFFRVDPPLRLKRGIVRFAALLQSSDGRGLNFLLCRRDQEDLYGTWVPTRVRVSALVDPRKLPRRPEPFGFDEQGIAEIQKADRAMHVFTLDYQAIAPGDAFLGLAQDAMQPLKRN